ncbi:uncharacterized protein LOC122028060 isoform X1 [Zingiber officinale]|uniref:ZFYVE26-like TPR repeats domain-containing protein n=2 Tax=Zingiber officinale TaxID=94328 RepID=A0A8J5C6L7_ZINOF|nr:uncharacterized protein LOC122028060 isoform X1 [Zingiber officinale]KAG6474190.1 hypothetical protein ZIOFF_068114 [Zingiber officinale]
MDPDAEHEIAMLTRVVGNHLALGQFEALRASLLSLRKRNPELALQILCAIISEGGRVEGVLWSESCPSPSHLAWLSLLELSAFRNSAASIGGVDPEVFRLNVEFLLLIQHACSKASNADLGKNAETSDASESAAQLLNDILNTGLRLLWSGIGYVSDTLRPVSLITKGRLKGLWKFFLDYPKLFDAICSNIHRQLEILLPAGTSDDLNVLSNVRQSVQMAHLDSLTKCTMADDLEGAFSNLQFLHLEYGVEEEQYKLALQSLVKKAFLQSAYYEKSWLDSRDRMFVMYTAAISTKCIRLVQIIQAIQDEMVSVEIEFNKISDANVIPLPIAKYLETLPRENIDALDGKDFSSEAMKCCMRDLYHYARISGKHILECIMDTALSAIKREQLEVASHVLSLFPLLQPLVAVLGWDLLSGKTTLRRRLMQLLWTSKSQVLRLEQFSLYKKQSDEILCVEYLCDVLCFHMDIARFVACVNSGLSWNSKNSLLFSQKDKITDEHENKVLDPFVENMILERLAVQSPMKVLFDAVAGIKFQEAFEILNMQPIASTSAVWKRMQDIELVHMLYVLESAVFALGTMERCINNDMNSQLHVAMSYLKNIQTHMEAIRNVSRRIFMVSIVISLLYLDEMSINITDATLVESYSELPQNSVKKSSFDGENKNIISFMGLLLDILRRNLPSTINEVGNMLDSSVEIAAKQVLEWRTAKSSKFIEDWEWRLTILDRLQPLSECQWTWKEALVIFRAAPSKLLNLCMQRAKYDIGEEAVRRFSLPPEDKAVLELSEWVAAAFRRASIENAVSHVAEGRANALQKLDISSLQSQLGSLAAILVCIDVSATSAKSVDMCKLLLDQAMSVLAEIFPGSSPKLGPSYWEQIQEVATISVTRHILQHLYDLLEQEKSLTLQEILSEERMIFPVNEPSKKGQRQRAIVILHQMIDDAHQGKRQFLSGKLHNLSKALAVEETENNYNNEEGSNSIKMSHSNKGTIVGLGLRAPKSSSLNPSSTESISEFTYELKDTGKRLFGPVTSKPSTYLSSFIIYIATIGDIVDGVDTTHDFNFFSLVYESHKDLLTRLVFDRGSTDAAGKIADIMGVDFVHEVILACVPPVFPPRSGHGWACIPILPTLSGMSMGRKISSLKASTSGSLEKHGKPLYPLQLSLVKHLAKLSPVRAVLACVFGSTILSSRNESSDSSIHSKGQFLQGPDTERLFYEFALDQSERFPTLKRWIQQQSNLHKISTTTITSKSDNNVAAIPNGKASRKRVCEPESDTESEVEDMVIGGHNSPSFSEFTTHNTIAKCAHRSAMLDDFGVDPASYVSFDWENEGPYGKAVERLIDEGKLLDALALSDRCLRDGASDYLLQLLIEQEEASNLVLPQPHGYVMPNFGSTSWQYCLRLKDKLLAARLALNYVHRWDLDPAIDVLTMCICHLPQHQPIRSEVLHMRQSLQRYHHILSADDHYTRWQQVEVDCKEDPEGLALRLAGKGAVSAALEVAESASLPIELRRELQGRQLVKLLTTDPLSGGGPAQASRFLSSLHESDDALPVAIEAMQLLPDLRSKQLLVHFFLKRRVGNLSDVEVAKLNLWALGLRVLSLLPLPTQQRCSSLHEHPHLILEVLLMMKQLQSASLILKEFPSLRDDNLILRYAAKAITINVSAAPREPRISISGSRLKHKVKIGTPSRPNIASNIGNWQREARRAFSWTTWDSSPKVPQKDVHRKRKISGFMHSDTVAGEGIPGIEEERPTSFSADGLERLPFVSIAEEWVLTGDQNKDNAVRTSHRYETSPDITLFKALLSLCSDDMTSARGALQLCVAQMKDILSVQNLPLNASMETISKAYHATETYAQALGYAKSSLKKLAGSSEYPNNYDKYRDVDDSSTETSSSSSGSQYPDELSELLAQAHTWLGRAEVLQSLLGSGIVASIDDIADKESSACLRDRLILNERYSMAVYTCRKCKIDALPVWNAWGHALIRMEHYSQARVKFKQAIQLHKGDPSSVILGIINTVEGGPPVDVPSSRSMYEHLAKSASTILDDSLSADSYLNILHMPSTFPRSQELSNGRLSFFPANFEDGPCSNLDNIRYAECIYYLQEYARQETLAFMFKHGRYLDACLLFFPPNSSPLSQSSQYAAPSPASSPQRADPLATDYGTIDDLCELCIDYGAMDVLHNIVLERSSASPEDVTSSQYMSAALTRICSYCETHRHFNCLYKFLVVKGDHVAAGLCCIQLYINSFSQEEAIKHLEHAKIHFDEGLSARHRAASETTRLVSKSIRGKSASEKLSVEGVVKFSASVSIQIDVVKSLNDSDGPQWKHSLFGNPSEPETFKRRCHVAEALAEKHFDLGFRVIYEFELPAVDIYAGVAASLAERKKGGQLTELFKNIKGTIDDDDWDQVLGTAINVYANKHRERPDRLIDMLISSHRKVLACVVCGRLKSAFQIASRSGSIADVEYVAHQASVANALPVVDMCRQWLTKYKFGI